MEQEKAKKDENAEEGISVSGTVTVGETIHAGVTLTYTWSEMSEIANAISANSNITKDTEEVNVTIGAKNYKVGVGDTVAFKYGETIHQARVLGFNHDILASDNTKKAGISFETANYVETHPMNPNKINEGEWIVTPMREYLEGSAYVKSQNASLGNNNQIGVINSLKDTNGNDIKDYIKEVSKEYFIDGSDTIPSTCNDKLWFLSCWEIWGNTGTGVAVGKEGEQYRYYARENKSNWNLLIGALEKNNVSLVSHWWVRSPFYIYYTYFCIVYSSGIGYDTYANYPFGFTLGFSI